MARALRVAVPLKAICSSMWDTPICWGCSLRLPVFTHIPTAALSRPGIGSLTTVKPLESLDISRVMAPIFSSNKSREDEPLYQSRVVGQNLQPFGQVFQPRKPLGLGRGGTDGLAHRLREFRGMGGGQDHHWRQRLAHP